MTDKSTTGSDKRAKGIKAAEALPIPEATAPSLPSNVCVCACVYVHACAHQQDALLA